MKLSKIIASFMVTTITLACFSGIDVQKVYAGTTYSWDFSSAAGVSTTAGATDIPVITGNAGYDSTNGCVQMSTSSSSGGNLAVNLASPVTIESDTTVVVTSKIGYGGLSGKYMNYDVYDSAGKKIVELNVNAYNGLGTITVGDYIETFTSIATHGIASGSANGLTNGYTTITTTIDGTTKSVKLAISSSKGSWSYTGTLPTGTSSNVAKLNFNTTYTNSGRSCYVDDISIVKTAGNGLSTVTTDAVTDYSTNAATLGGAVTSDGGFNVTDRGFVYGITTNPTTSDNVSKCSSGTGTFTTQIVGLKAGTTYYVRAYATNGSGTAYGDCKSFTTSAETGYGGIIQNDTFWKDTSGNPIYSQGGGILKVGDTYYWYGVHYKGAESYFTDPTVKKDKETNFISFSCYSSKDLVNWKFEKDILTADQIGNPGWAGRCGVFYNKSTNKYVLVSQHSNGELFATCDTPNGDFALNNIQFPVSNVANSYTGDQTVFTDDDGKSYLICSSSNGRSYLYVAPFSDDGLSVGPATQIYHGNGREGNCMFKYNGYYYFTSSDLHGWNASHTYYIRSKNIFGPYETEQVMQGTDNDFSHVSQTGFYTNVTGSEGTTVLYCGDRWSDFAGNGEGYNQWIPLSFDGDVPYFNSVSEFNIDAEKGTWSVGSNNNYILNPNFEADRVSQTSLIGWKFSSNIPEAVNLNESGSYLSGNFDMKHSYTTAYQATTYQDITNLPNGRYTLKAFVKSSGGQNTCNVFAKDFGGTEKDYAINTAITGWTEITIPNINVINGKCQVGVYSDASANQYCQVDNFSLTRTGALPTQTQSVTFQGVDGTSINTQSVVYGSSATVPTVPKVSTDKYKYGYSYKWDTDATKVTSDLTIKPILAKNSTTYNVSVGGQTLAGAAISGAKLNVGQTVDAGTTATSGSYAAKDIVTVAAPTVDGHTFSYWRDDKGNIISYKSTYTFYVTAGVTLTAVYDDATSQIPSINMRGAINDTVNGKISFIAEKDLPSGYTLSSYGIILTNKAATGLSTSDFQLGTVGITDGSITQETAQINQPLAVGGTYVVNKGAATGETWYGRGYLIYKDSQGTSHTIYSNILSSKL
jgi:hypothetical protein